MRRAGQAAMEFLMTYGWAIMVVLTVIGVLAYFGFLNPEILMQERCVVPLPLKCEDYLVKDGDVAIHVYNAGMNTMKLTSIKYESEAFVDTGTDCEAALAIDLEPGNAEELNVIDGVNCQYKSTGKLKNKYKVTIKYKWFDASQEYALRGELFAARTE